MTTTRLRPVSATSITLLLFVVVCLLIRTSSCDLSISIAEYVKDTLTPSTKIVIDESRDIQIAPNTTYVITCEGGNNDLNDISWTRDQNNIAMMNVDNVAGTESKVFYDKTETTTSKLYLWNFNQSLSGSYTCHSTVGNKTLNIIENNPAIILSETYLPRKESDSASVNIKFFLSGVSKFNFSTFTWYFEDNELDNDLQSFLKLIFIISSNSIILKPSVGFGKQNDGVYTGVLTTPAGTSNASFILDVQFRPSIILSSDCNCSTDNIIVINENSNLTLSCVDMNADPPPQFTWFKDGIKDPENLIIENSSVVVEQISKSESQLKFFNVMLENAGKYYCKANNTFYEKIENIIVYIPYVRIWYSNPLPGSILKNNTAISVYTMVNEIRCYSGDTAANNNNTDIISPPGSSSLVFSNSAAGRLVKSGSESISSVDNGIYTCVYTVDSEEYQMSFGVYSRDREPNLDDGTPLSIQSVDYIIDELTMTVTCTSTGWPATQVTWIKDDDILTSDSTYSISQTITDRTESTYENVLNVMGSSQDDLLGTYECEVKCLRHNDQTIDTALGSVTIQSVGNLMVVITTLDYAEVGSTYELNCTVNKNGGSPTITWKKSSVTLVTNLTAGIQVGDPVDQGDTVSVTLTLSPLHQSHDGQYSCTGQVNSAMGTATVGVDVGIPTLPVSITPGIEITATVGVSVTLECHTSLPESLNGNIASINWTHNGAEVTEGVTNMLAKGESSLDLGAVVSADAGTYTCNVQIQSEFVDVDSHLIATNTTNLTIQMPVPKEHIIAPQPIIRQYFSGIEISFTCLFTIDNAINDDTNAVVTADWRKGDSLLTGDSRLSVTAPELLSGETYFGQLHFDYLTLLDSGNYSCEAFVTSNLISEFITDTSQSSSIMINVEGPTPEINLTSSTLRLPTHPDYNQATLTCTATLPLPPEIDELEFDKVFRWTMSGTDVTSDATTPTDPRGIESVSTLTRELTIAGDIVFRCEVTISIPGDPVVSNSSSVTITVLGASNPVQPTNLTIVDITYYKVTIQWTVTSIAYTPEQYIILYGLNESSLTQESDIVNGTMDFNSINDTYSVTITELDFNTVYYYQVRSTNTEGSTNSDVVMFQTPKIPPTAPPENFIIIVINSTALKLQWDLPPEEHRNGIIIAYTLSCEEMISDEYLLVSSPDFPLIVTENGPVSLILNGFRPGTAFNCAVSASNLAATGPSTTSSAITDEEPPAGPPLNFTILDMTSHTFTVTWSPPDPFLHYGVIISYNLTCEEVEGGHIPLSYPRMFTGPPISSVIVDNLRPFTDYKCSLIAINSAGNSEPTTDTSITDEDAPESYPRDFMITAIELRSLTFLWKPVDKRLQNGPIINYTIICNSSSILSMEISPDVLIEDSNGVYNYTIFGFTPATVYMCSIYANTSVGAGPEISAIGITLEEIISTTSTSSVSIVTTSMTSTATQGTSNIGLIIVSSLLSCILCVVLTCVIVIISILIYKRRRKSKHDDMSNDAIQTKNIYSPPCEIMKHNTSKKKCDENIVTKMSITYGMVENKQQDTSRIYEEIDTLEYKTQVISTKVPTSSSNGVYETIV